MHCMSAVMLNDAKPAQESYLLRTRLHKMPYKHIANHLHKTELACRLHYHQMSYGSNRRKRTGSVSSTCSSNSITPLSALRDFSPERTPYTNLSPVASPPSSHESASVKPASFTSSSPSSQQRAHVPILPKPISSVQGHMPGSAMDLSKSLRLDTTFTMPSQVQHSRPSHIDSSRLRALYTAHRNSFWSQIASQYSHESRFSATELEEAFFASNQLHPVRRGTSPPTPEHSPQTLSTPSFSAPVLTAVEPKGFSAINATPVISAAVSAPSPFERCAVSALLNETKDDKIIEE